MANSTITNIYKKKLVISNDYNPYIGFPENIDLNDITYIKESPVKLPSGKFSASRIDYCCIFCNKDCHEKIGNMCSVYKKGIVCPNANEVHVKDFKSNSRNYAWLKERIQMMKYLLVFGELSAWAYDNKNISVTVEFDTKYITIFDTNPSTKFENISENGISKEQIEKKIQESCKYKRLQNVNDIYGIRMLRAIYYSYIKYFENYADLCTAAAFIPENERELYKIQLSTVGMNYEYIDKYVHKVSGYYLFDTYFDVYISSDQEKIVPINDYIGAIRTENDKYYTIYVKSDKIVEAAESVKTAPIEGFFRYSRLNGKLLEKIISHLAETAKTK